MEIRLIAIGRNREKAFRDMEAEYIKRLSSFCRIQIEEVKDEPDEHSDRPAQAQKIMDVEAQRALARIKPDDYVILLDLHGREWSSEAFAQHLADWQMHHSSLVFVIAGSLGPGSALKERANVRWKLSDLTFTHLFTRQIVLEQIYRGFMINAGRHYHK